MKFSIHKFVVPFDLDNGAFLPIGSKIVHCDIQNGNICVWATVEIGSPIPTCGYPSVVIFPTGLQIDDYEFHHYDHLKTFQMDSGLVWHVFARIEVM